MHKYTTEITTDNIQRHDRNRYTLRHYFSEDSSGSVCYFVVECTCYILDIVACRLNDMLVLFMFYIFFINTSKIREKSEIKVIVFFFRFSFLYFSSRLFIFLFYVYNE